MHRRLAGAPAALMRSFLMIASDPFAGRPARPRSKEKAFRGKRCVRFPPPSSCAGARRSHSVANSSFWSWNGPCLPHPVFHQTSLFVTLTVMPGPGLCLGDRHDIERAGGSLFSRAGIMSILVHWPNCLAIIPVVQRNIPRRNITCGIYFTWKVLCQRARHDCERSAWHRYSRNARLPCAG